MLAQQSAKSVAGQTSQGGRPLCRVPRASAGDQPQRGAPRPGPAPQGARREARQAPQGRPPQPAAQRAPVRPRLDLVVLVEGVNDRRAVQRAVDADVFVLGSATQAGNAAALGDLRRAASRPGCRGVVVLTDPDVAGRQARNALDDALGGCWHAFVPAPLATAGAATRNHEEGNVGVEHAAPDVLRRVLGAPRPSDASREAFTREALMGEPFRLIAPLHERGGDVNRRRELVCSYLGIGMCDGKQLLRQLNRYCFSAADLTRALAWATQQLQSMSPPDSSA